MRGGFNAYGLSAGIFDFKYAFGYMNSFVSFRVVLILCFIKNRVTFEILNQNIYNSF